MMQNDVIAKVDHGVAWVGLCEGAADDHVTRLYICKSNLVKPSGYRVLDVKVFSPHPPAISPFEIGQVYPGEVVCVTEQRVAVHSSVDKRPA